MKVPTIRRFAVLLALAALPAMGSESKPVALDPLAQRLCDALHALPETRKAQCCNRAPSSSLAGECTRALSAVVREKAVRLDATAIGRCEEEASRELAGCGWVTPLMPRNPEVCGAVVQGERAAGAACSSSLECREGLFCRGGGPAGTGVCAASGAPGAACGGSVDVLASYTRQTDLNSNHPECAGYCLAGRCTAFAALNGACSTSKQCEPGQHCGTGRCRQGVFSASDETCSATSCAPDTVCKEGKCVALKAAGEICTSPFECKAACNIPKGAKTGTCGMKCGTSLPPATPAAGGVP